jgi:DNA-directed RNA polymerase specialized sigma24 family protein
MSDPNHIYPSDLEWMVQSGQVPHDLLLEVLLEKYYNQIFLYALAILDSKREARIAAHEVFSKAMIGIHQYQPNNGVEIWLFQIAWSICKKMLSRVEGRRMILASIPFIRPNDELGDSTPRDVQDAELWFAFDQLRIETRRTAILSFLLGWEPEDIAHLDNVNQEVIESELEKVITRTRPSWIIKQADRKNTHLENPHHTSESEYLDTWKLSLQRRWQTESVSGDDLDKIKRKISLRAKWLAHHRQGALSVMEIVVISILILLAVGIVWGMNQAGETSEPSNIDAGLIHTVLVTKQIQRIITATPLLRGNPVQISPTPVGLEPDLYTTLHNDEDLLSIAKKLAVEVSTIEKLNRIPDRSELTAGERILIPGKLEIQPQTIPTPIPTFRPAPLLTEPYFSESVLQRFAVQGPQYHTVWFDAKVYDYGPISYIGPTRILRWQSWLGDYQSLHLIGFPDNFPSEIMLRNYERSFYALPSQDLPWFSEWRALEQSSNDKLENLARALPALIDTRDLERGFAFVVRGRDLQANIPALEIDVFDQEDRLYNRLWYDESHGFILRRIFFSLDDPERPMYEVKVDSLAFDISFPQDLFDSNLPWRGSYAGDPSGIPDKLGVASERHLNGPLKAIQPAPAEFDIGSSTLTFQYPESFSSTSLSSNVQILADNYWIGETNFGNPWTMICDRSLDGKVIAYVSRPVQQHDVSSRLKILRLPPDNGMALELKERFGVSEFAIAPNNRQVLYFSRPNTQEKGYLGLVNIPTLEDQILLSLGDVNSLVWHPDGNQFAMIARFEPDSYAENVAVYNLDKRELTYNASIDFQSGNSLDWPMGEWGIEFPVEMGGMDDCALPALEGLQAN